MGLIDASKMGKDAITELHQINKNLERIAKALETANDISFRRENKGGPSDGSKE